MDGENPSPQKTYRKKNVLLQTVSCKRRQRVKKSDGDSQTTSEFVDDIGSGGWAHFIGTGIAFAAVVTYIYTNTDDILDLLVNSIGEISIGLGVISGKRDNENMEPESAVMDTEELIIREDRRRWSLEEIDKQQH